MKKNNNPKFNYAGHTFQGVRLFTDEENLREISRQQQSKVNLDVVEWDWKAFYKAAYQNTDVKYDIFLMDGKYEVLPAHNGLFIWGVESDEWYIKEQDYTTKFRKLEKDLEQIRLQYIYVIKQKMIDYDVTSIPISDDGRLIRATFIKHGLCSEIIRSIALMDGRLQFDTDNGIFTEEQLACGIEELISVMTF